MANKKISALPLKPVPSSTDVVPIVDTANPNNFETKRATVASLLSLMDAVTQAEKNAPNGVATLNNDGKIPLNQLPAIAITNTYVVNSEAAMLALEAETGDVAVRTDVGSGKSFILAQEPAAVLANWIELVASPPPQPTDLDGGNF